MNIFITGGAGYIGSATAEALINEGHKVTVYDSLVTGHQAAIPKEAEFIHASLDDLNALTQALTSKKYDAIMHFAAFIEAGESMQDPGKFFRNNFTNSLSLMETAVKAGVKKIVFSSTAAVYQSSEEPLTEESPIGPTNVYGHTKLMTEQALEWYRSIYGLHFAVLRYFNACGALPGRGEAHQPESHLIPRVLQIALGQAESATIFGTDYPTPDGTCIRDYIHIADLVSAHILALDALDKKDKLLYNVGSGNGFSVRDVIETARRVTNHPIPSIEAPRRLGDSARLVASPKKIMSELGWKPQNTNLQDILSSAWEWHKSNPNGYA
jgi:UDP-glucose 4-epimerase